MSVRMRNIGVTDRSVSNESIENQDDVYVTNASKLLHIMQQKRDLEQERRFASRIPL